MRNLEKGQHIFIAFQGGKAVLDSQLRPRIYTSLENADKWTPTVNKGKIEYVEYAPTLTPPNEWDERGGKTSRGRGTTIHRGQSGRNWLLVSLPADLQKPKYRANPCGQILLRHYPKVVCE